ncbi:hypothetical protein VNO77_21666 [Canavalia gladiata]|uniref:Uncharacterized protein n=1 Tax=Canavalia gladiata TaxID=3824 RepID=A0AAN9LVQ6_CANGL
MVKVNGVKTIMAFEEFLPQGCQGSAPFAKNMKATFGMTLEKSTIFETIVALRNNSWSVMLCMRHIFKEVLIELDFVLRDEEENTFNSGGGDATEGDHGGRVSDNQCNFGNGGGSNVVVIGVVKGYRMALRDTWDFSTPYVLVLNLSVTKRKKEGYEGTDFVLNLKHCVNRVSRKRSPRRFAM